MAGASVAMELKGELIHRTDALLGEGPVWDPRSGVLWWVDIAQGRIHRFDPATGEDECFQLDVLPGAVTPASGGGLLAATDAGFVRYIPESRTCIPIVHPEREILSNRFNDGKCDPAGRFWAGTMNRRGSGNHGALYSLDADKIVRRHLTGIGISNGLAWSLDARTFYHTDTPTRVVTAYDFDVEVGTIANPRVAIDLHNESGVPDGMALDADGMLWVAMWGGGRVIRCDPASGRKIGQVRLPVSQPSSCCFGGERLDRLYITSARIDLDETRLAREPLAGSLFGCEPGVAGAHVSVYTEK